MASVVPEPQIAAASTATPAARPSGRRELWQSIAVMLEPEKAPAIAMPRPLPRPGPAVLGARPVPIGRAASYRALLVGRWPRDGWAVLHLGISAVLLWLSVILVTPSHPFGASVSRDLSRVMAPEWAWALALGAGAGVGFWGVTTRSALVRQSSCALLCVLHVLVALCVVFSDPASTGGGTYSVLAVLALVRLAVGR